MAENALFPAYAVVAYDSPWGAHKMTVPTRNWEVGLGTNGFGGYTGWDGVTINDAETMFLGLANVLKPFHIPGTTIKDASVYVKASATSPAILKTIIPLNVVGTNMGTTQAKAVQQTFNGKSTVFTPYKVVILDAPVGSSFDKVLAAAFGAADLALEGYLTDLTHAFQARAEAPPQGFQNKTITLNDKLRKEYGMA